MAHAHSRLAKLRVCIPRARRGRHGAHSCRVGETYVSQSQNDLCRPLLQRQGWTARAWPPGPRPFSELGLESPPRSRGSWAVRGPSRKHKAAGSIPAARFRYAPRLEGPGLVAGPLGAQGELGLETAPRSRGRLAVRGPPRNRQVASSPCCGLLQHPEGRGPRRGRGPLAALGELGLKTARRRRGSLAARCPSRNRKVASSTPTAHFCSSPRLEGPSLALAMGAPAAQGELGKRAREAAAAWRPGLRVATTRSQTQSLLPA
jgi:hypothetical protein